MPSARLSFTDPEVAHRIRALANGEGNPLRHMMFLERMLSAEDYEVAVRLALPALGASN